MRTKIGIILLLSFIGFTGCAHRGEDVLQNQIGTRESEVIRDGMYVEYGVEKEFTVFRINEDRYVNMEDGEEIYLEEGGKYPEMEEGHFSRVKAIVNIYNGGEIGYMSNYFIVQLESVEKLDFEETIDTCGIECLKDSSFGGRVTFLSYRNEDGLYLLTCDRNIMYIFLEGDLVYQYDWSGLTVEEMTDPFYTYLEEVKEDKNKDMKSNVEGVAIPEMTVSINQLYWVQYDLSKSMYPTKEELEALTQKYLTELADVLHMNRWWDHINPDATYITLIVEMDAGDKSYMSASFQKEKDKGLYGKVNLSTKFIDSAQRMDGALAHELTHAVGFSYETFSASLDEGICEYVQRMIGDYEYPNDVSYMELSSLSLPTIEEAIAKGAFSREELDEVFAQVGSAGTSYPFEMGRQLKLWYSFSAAFTEYLIQEYGVEEVVELTLHGIDENSYREILGVDFTEVKERWIKDMKDMETTYTVEELANYMENKRRRDYGYSS